jgi:ribosomal protein L40E
VPEIVAQEPEPAPPPASASSASWAPAPRPEQPQEWQPIGAHWSPRPSEPAAWPPPEADVAASMAARSQLDQTAEDEIARVSAMWAESAQRVIDRGTARVCYRCSLPLSTHARYCRRCGTNQQG